MASVLIEIRHDIVSREIEGIATRDGKVRQPRKAANGVEMEPVVTPRPRSTQLTVLLEDDGLESLARKRGRCRQTRRAAADDDYR
jgi:hypothetical protein